MDVVQGFKLPPGCCHVCRGAGGSKWVIDTRREDAGELKRIQVYICEDCVIAMAKMLEPHLLWVLASKELMAMLAEESAESDLLRERAERAERILAELASMLPAAEVPG